MLERMYQKRLSAYAAMGYTVYAPTGSGEGNVLFTVKDYQETFWQDFQNAVSRVCISSPRLSQRRVWEFVKRLKQDSRLHMEYIILTMPASTYSDDQGTKLGTMKKALRDAGAEVRDVEKLNCHFAVMDEDLVWYGSMNFLSKEHDNDILMRLRSEAIVKELLAMGKSIDVKKRE